MVGSRARCLRNRGVRMDGPEGRQGQGSARCSCSSRSTCRSTSLGSGLSLQRTGLNRRQKVVALKYAFEVGTAGGTLYRGSGQLLWEVNPARYNGD